MITTKENKINITEEDLYKIGFEFHSFYNTFSEDLNYNYRRRTEEEKRFLDFPSYCFMNFTQSILNYQKK